MGILRRFFSRVQSPRIVHEKAYQEGLRDGREHKTRGFKDIADIKERRLAYFKAGYTDQEVAEFEGRSRKGIASYRVDVLGLPPNKKKE